MIYSRPERFPAGIHKVCYGADIHVDGTFVHAIEPRGNQHEAYAAALRWLWEGHDTSGPMPRKDILITICPVPPDYMDEAEAKGFVDASRASGS